MRYSVKKPRRDPSGTGTILTVTENMMTARHSTVQVWEEDGRYWLEKEPTSNWPGEISKRQKDSSMSWKLRPVPGVYFLNRSGMLKTFLREDSTTVALPALPCHSCGRMRNTSNWLDHYVRRKSSICRRRQ